jgi:hypothetical protein
VARAWGQERVTAVSQRGPMSIALLAVFLLGQVGLGIDKTVLPTLPKPVSCATAADPAIDSATQEMGETKNGIDTFLIHVSVLNRGGKSQGPRVKQVVSVYHNEERTAEIGVPSLQKGEAYAFTVRYRRNADAGANSTTLLLRLGGLNYLPQSVEDCNQSNNSFYLTF